MAKRGFSPKKLAACLSARDAAGKRAMRAMSMADKRGYTATVHSKGSLWDDPRVQAATRRHSVLIQRCQDMMPKSARTMRRRRAAIFKKLGV